MLAVAVDFDNTLYDLLSRVEEYLSDKGITFKKDNVVGYGFEGDIGCSKEEVYASFEDPEFFEGLKLFDGTRQALNELKEVAEVFAYTLGCDAGYDIRMRQITSVGLRKYMPFREKKPYIKGFDVLIEDNPKVVAMWRKAGFEGTIYLVDYPYNKHIDSKMAVRVSSFSEAVELIKESCR